MCCLFRRFRRKPRVAPPVVSVPAAAPVTLTKTTALDAWDAGAYSDIDSAASGNCYVECEIPVLNADVKNALIGLSADNPGGVRNIADFGVQIVYADSAKQLYAIENGTLINGGAPEVTSFVAGDIIRVEVSGSNVLYKKNGVTFQTTTPTITYPLKPCACLHAGTPTPKAVIKNAVVSINGAASYGVTWANLVGATTS